MLPSQVWQTKFQTLSWRDQTDRDSRPTPEPGMILQGGTYCTKAEEASTNQKSFSSTWHGSTQGRSNTYWWVTRQKLTIIFTMISSATTPQGFADQAVRTPVTHLQSALCPNHAYGSSIRLSLHPGSQEVSEGHHQGLHHLSQGDRSSCQPDHGTTSLRQSYAISALLQHGCGLCRAPPLQTE